MTRSSGTTSALLGVAFADVNNGTAVGDSGTILHTTNGGRTWVSQSSGTCNSLTGVCFTDAYTGTVVGGVILRTTDAGATWTSQSSPASRWLGNVTFTDATTAWVVGDYGTILHTTTGGTTWVEGERHAVTPHEYVLSQNYPNPFNPRTNIKFQIPGTNFVSLKVYDLLGREVATLVNEVKQPGTHTVQFDGSNLSTGVYFYKMSVTPAASRDLVPTSRDGQAGSFAATRKLLLLK